MACNQGPCSSLTMKNLSLIGAAALNWAIGYKGCIPWHISADFKYFKSVTSGHTVIMGLGTWISLDSKPLPGRRNLVVSDRPATFAELETGAEFFPTLDAALESAGTQEEVFCIGGGMMYRQTLPLAGKVYLTRVHTNVDPADTFFPEVRDSEWKEESRSDLFHDEKSGLDFEFIVYTRKRS